LKVSLERRSALVARPRSTRARGLVACAVICALFVCGLSAWLSNDGAPEVRLCTSSAAKHPPVTPTFEVPETARVTRTRAIEPAIVRATEASPPRAPRKHVRDRIADLAAEL